ncbi:MAG: COR domain-containing protein [Bacteroidota bacterium]
MTFRDKVEQELKKLNRDQQVAFSWRCAVRSLPFLTIKKRFHSWSPKRRQIHLYSIFNALDLTVVAAKTTATSAAASALAAAEAAAIAAGSADVGSATRYTSFAVAAAARTASKTTSAHRIPLAGLVTANFDIAAEKLGLDIQFIIMEDLEAVKLNHNPSISTTTYGQAWGQFLVALENEGCHYWGKLYQNIFENNFELDKEALQRRLNVPEEIRKQGAAAVGQYLEELVRGAKNLNESRIIILGEKGAGKTCIARKLVDPKAGMTTADESTRGVDTLTWELEEEDLKVRIWDFAGHVVTHAVHQFFLSERCLYVVVYDGRTEKRNRLEYWLDHMKNHGGNSEAIILVNERDRHRVNIPINYLKEKYAIAGFYSLDVKNDKKELNKFRSDIADYIKNNPSWKNQEIPKSYYSVKEELEKVFDPDGKRQGPEHIKKEVFETIAEKYEVKDSQRLLKDLHALGVSLWYDEMEEYDTLILNPEWISEGVYQIINWVNEAKEYSIKLSDFETVFAENKKRFSKNKHRFLFKLIKHYELAYESKNGRLIIPHLLPEDQPAKLPEFLSNNGLMMKYEADHPLPPNTISRFIVRHNEQIRKEKNNYLVWKYGVILQDGKGSLALVRERDRTIEISVKGKDKTNYISQLRKTLNNIFESYKSQDPKLTYKIIGDQFDVPPELWLPEQEIVVLDQRNKPYYDYRTNRDIPMQPTVIHYNITNHQYFIRESENIIIGGERHQITKNTFNFHDCNIGLQGNLNELMRGVAKKGNKEDAKELAEVVEILEEIKEGANKEEVKRKGGFQKLRRIVEDLGDKNSTIHKTVEGLRRGVSIAQGIAEEYNKIAQWCGLPQVPKPFLKKDK